MRTRRAVTRSLALGGTCTTVLFAGCTDIAQDLGLVERELGGASGPAPRASFSMTYDAQGGQVTVTHDGGAEVPAANVYVRGTGLEQTGSWIDLGGDTDTADGEAIINAGSALSVGASPDFSARVVWDSGGDTRVYAEASGPDA